MHATIARVNVGKLHSRRELHLCRQMYRRSRIPKYIDNMDLAARQFDKNSPENS